MQLKEIFDIFLLSKLLFKEYTLPIPITKKLFNLS